MKPSSLSTCGCSTSELADPEALAHLELHQGGSSGGTVVLAVLLHSPAPGDAK